MDEDIRMMINGWMAEDGWTADFAKIDHWIPNTNVKRAFERMFTRKGATRLFPSPRAGFE